MPDFCPYNDAPPFARALHCNYIRDRMLMGVMLFTLVRTGEALAGGQATIAEPTLDTEFGIFRKTSPPATALVAAPEIFTAPAPGTGQVFSATDFRPLNRTVPGSDPVMSSFGDAPLMRGTTVWQQMAQYKSHDRVQVLTLWQTAGSTISLQAGKRGDPSLQWTSRMMNRGGSTQGLLDRLFAVSLTHAGSGLHHATRSNSPPGMSKPAGMGPLAGGK